MNHTHVLALLLLLPPIYAHSISKQERIQQLEERIHELQDQKVDAQMTIMLAPWTLCCLSENDREILKKAFMEYDAEFNVLYRELIQLFAEKE